MKSSALLLLRLLPLVVAAGCDAPPGPKRELCYTPGARFPAETPELPCVPAADQRLKSFLDREGGYSADFINEGPFERTEDGGEVRCCYITQERPSGSGRPLIVAATARLSPLRASPSWLG